MVEIVPTVTAYTTADYKHQLELASRLSPRISLDFMDGELTPKKNLNLIQAYWPPGKIIDLHLMYQRPTKHTETIISLQPHLAVIHAEASGELTKMMKELKAVGIKTGVAFLQASDPLHYGELLESADHALIFSGQLGQYGGTADLSLLEKVNKIRSLAPRIEISWDGGVNDINAAQLTAGGINVLNVGGYLQQAADAQAAYATLKSIVNGGGQ